MDLYTATNGPNWRNSTNWLNGDPCSQKWSGVYCSNDTVAGLYVARWVVERSNLPRNQSINQSSIDSLSILDDHHHHIEQGPLLQSTERHHSIIDWLSRESRVLVRSIQHMTLKHSFSNQSLTCIISINQSIGTLSLSLSLSRYFMITITLNRFLYDNQLSGTIPSSIGPLVKLRKLYAQSTHDTHKHSFSNQSSTSIISINQSILTLSLSLDS